MNNKQDETYDAAMVIGTRRKMREMADGTLRVEVDIDPQFRDKFLKDFSEINSPLVLARMSNESAQKANSDALIDECERKEESAKPFGKLVSELHRTNWFMQPDVLHSIGSDADFLEWLKEQPCAVGAPVRVGEALCPAHGDVVPAHVRRVPNGSGAAIKPEYSAIPLSDNLHQLQHQKGESVFPGGREWFDKQRVKYVTLWAKETLAAALGFESMGHVDPEVFIEWCKENQIRNIPRCYLDAR